MELRIVAFGRHVLSRLNAARRRSAERLRPLRAYVWRRLMWRTTVIAITGSIGKTTCKECLAAILATHGNTLKTRHNENDGSGVPGTLLAIRPWHRYAVVEVGTHGPGNMVRLARLTKPDIAIVLRVARTHTNAFSTLDDTATEKAQLLRHLSRRGVAVLNWDDPRVQAMSADCGDRRVVSFGTSERVDYRGHAPDSSWPRRLSFTLTHGAHAVPVTTRLVGTHWLASTLAAVAASHVCGVPLANAVAALTTVAPFTGRMQPVTLPSGAVVIRDEETGSPDSLDAMVKAMRDADAMRRILVIGDVSDRRGNSRRRQRDLGKLAAEVAQVAVFVDDHGHHAGRAAVQAGMDPAACHVVPDLRDAAELLRTMLRSGDLVFLKGKTTEHLTRILFAQFGAIGCWTTSCRIRRLCDLCSRLKPEFDLDEMLKERV